MLGGGFKYIFMRLERQRSLSNANIIVVNGGMGERSACLSESHAYSQILKKERTLLGKAPYFPQVSWRTRDTRHSRAVPQTIGVSKGPLEGASRFGTSHWCHD